MQTANRRRTTWAVAASVLTHVALLAIALLQRPHPPLHIGEASAPPEVVIQVLLTPRPQLNRLNRLDHPPPPTPLRLHRAPPLPLPPTAPTAPIASPALAAAPPPPGPVAVHPSPLPEGPKGDVRTALRQGPVGCANQQAVGLNRAEREHCDEVFGKGTKDAQFAGLGLAADKQRMFDATGAKKEADYRYKHSQVPGAVQDTERPGKTAEGMKNSLGVSGHAATVPF